MKLTILATVFALVSTAALAQPRSEISRASVGTATAPSIGVYNRPFGTTNVVPTWQNTNPLVRGAPTFAPAPFSSGVRR
jgi:hypothetical protein